jgi:hypothetical protein
MPKEDIDRVINKDRISRDVKLKTKMNKELLQVERKMKKMGQAKPTIGQHKFNEKDIPF